MHIFGERGRDFAVGEPAVVVERVAAPGAEVHFVNRDRRCSIMRLTAARHPVGIAPLVAAQVPDLRRGSRARFAGEGVRVGLLDPVVVDAREYRELVKLAGLSARNKRLPDTRGANGPQAIRAGFPVVKVTDDRHLPRIRRPHREPHAGNTVALRQVRSQLLVSAIMCAFGPEVSVEFGERRLRHGRALLRAVESPAQDSIQPARCQRLRASIRSTTRNPLGSGSCPVVVFARPAGALPRRVSTRTANPSCKSRSWASRPSSQIRAWSAMANVKLAPTLSCLPPSIVTSLSVIRRPSTSRRSMRPWNAFAGAGFSAFSTGLTGRSCASATIGNASRIDAIRRGASALMAVLPAEMGASRVPHRAE